MVVVTFRRLHGKRYCKDCIHFHGELSLEDMEFLNRMLRQYSAERMLRSWVGRNQITMPGGRRIDRDKAKVVNLLRKKAWCQRECVTVSAVDPACYAWQPRAFS